jgi:hypothetical protein
MKSDLNTYFYKYYFGLAVFLCVLCFIKQSFAQTAIFHQMHPSSGTPYNRCIRINNNIYPGNLTLSDPKGPNVQHPTWSPAFEMFFLNDDGSAQAGGGTSMTWVGYPVSTTPTLTSSGSSSPQEIRACDIREKSDFSKLFAAGLLNESASTGGTVFSSSDFIIGFWYNLLPIDRVAFKYYLGTGTSVCPTCTARNRFLQTGINSYVLVGNGTFDNVNTYSYQPLHVINMDTSYSSLSGYEIFSSSADLEMSDLVEDPSGAIFIVGNNLTANQGMIVSMPPTGTTPVFSSYYSTLDGSVIHFNGACYKAGELLVTGYAIAPIGGAVKNFLLASINPTNGAVNWAKNMYSTPCSGTYFPNLDEEGYSVAIADDGGFKKYVVGGRTFTYDHPNSDGIVMQYNTSFGLDHASLLTSAHYDDAIYDVIDGLPGCKNVFMAGMYHSLYFGVTVPTSAMLSQAKASGDLGCGVNPVCLGNSPLPLTANSVTFLPNTVSSFVAGDPDGITNHAYYYTSGQNTNLEIRKDPCVHPCFCDIQADFSMDANGCVGKEVNFLQKTYVNPDQRYLIYSWVYQRTLDGSGSGVSDLPVTFSTLSQPENFVFALAGTYTITMTVSTEQCSRNISYTFVVYDMPVSSPVTITTSGGNWNFSAGTYTAGLTYTWTLKDVNGNSVSTYSSSISNAWNGVTISPAGTYSICVKVDNGHGCGATNCTNFCTKGNLSLTVSTPDYLPCIGNTILVHNISANGDYYDWFVDGVLSATNTTNADFSWAFTEPGTHTIMLVGIRECLFRYESETTSVTITIYPKPQACFSYKYILKDLTSVNLYVDPVITSPPGLNYTWNLVDNPSSPVFLGSSSSITSDFTSLSFGKHTIQLTITDPTCGNNYICTKTMCVSDGEIDCCSCNSN